MKPTHGLLTRGLLLAFCALPFAAPSEANGGAGLPHGNARRTGYIAQDLRPPYRAVWMHAARHPPRPAWREPAWEPQRIDFDYAYAVSAAGDTVYYASSSDHALHALDLSSGRQRWKYVTDGPVRLAPDFHGGHVLFSSDDGFVYCLDQGTGRLVWKYQPSAPDSRLIGNEQMISRWPARSGVLVEDDRVYTTFGMLSPEGVAVCCLDARTGQPIWTNDTCGYRYMARPHLATMGGVSPQGYLAVGDDLLVVTCGRSTPALFDKRTGECRYHEADGDFTGGALAMTADGLVFVQADTLQKEFGSQLRRDDPSPEAEIFPLATLVALDGRTGREVLSLRGGARGVLSDAGQLTVIGRKRLLSARLDDVRGAVGKKTLIKHTLGHFADGEAIAKWTAPVERVYALLQAGGTIIAGGRGTVEAFDAADGHRLWRSAVEGQARAMCIASGHLIVSTTAGRIYCFVPTDRPDDARPEPVTPPTIPFEQAKAPPWPDGLPRGGYCLIAGKTDAAFLAILARHFDLVVHAATDGDTAATRERLDQAGFYGTRVVVHRFLGPGLPYTDYFANAVLFHATSRMELEAMSVADLYRCLRPCGGVARITCPDALASAVRQALVDAEVPVDEITTKQGCVLVRRGALPGAGEWTHQYGNPGKRVSSEERRVRLPLKAVWFGGLGPATLVSRHFREPAPLVIDGRCFVPGTDHLTAMDIYNGRILWQRNLPALAHWPAAYRGPSLAVDHEAVYAVQGLKCLRLDPATGRTVGTLEPPKDEVPTGEDVEWEYLAVAGDLVVGTVGHANIKHEWWSKAYPVNHVLFALEKNTGRLRWRHRPEEGIDSNAIAIDDGRIFVIDGRPRYGFLAERRGGKPSSEPRSLKALDLATGRVLWETDDLVPTLNSLWADDGVVVATPAPFARTMVDPNAAKHGGGIAAYAADTGKRLWRIEQTKSVVPMITDGVLYTPLAVDLATGRPLPPRAGGKRQFSAGLALLCGTLCGCPTLAMGRQSSLGFNDLLQQSGRYQYSIVRSSCWINMIPAGGLVVVPEGGSSCQCAYNYKTSLALMSDDRHFHFGIGGSGLPGKPALRLNLGAPGDRPDADGHVWHAWPRPVAYGRCLGSQPYGPKVAGPRLPVEPQPKENTWRPWGRNPDWTPIAGTDKPWLHSFGLEGAVRLRIQVPTEIRDAGPMHVTLYFTDLAEHEKPRVFDVRLQGEPVLSGFDVVREAGGPCRAVTREFTLLPSKTITLELVPRDPDGPPPTISGVAIVGEAAK